MPVLDLAAWLERLEQLHPSAIDLGLERCGEVAQRLELLETTATTITVAGTNGKGSTVAVMQAVLCATGNCVGDIIWRNISLLRADPDKSTGIFSSIF